MLQITDGKYRTALNLPTGIRRIFPTASFYFRLFGIVLKSSRTARKGLYSDEEWARSSADVLRELEAIGLDIEFTGVENLKNIDGPVVIIGNHMSMMETMLLPCVVQPIKSVTYVIKKSLLEYPVFKHVMQSRNPIAISRTNPRQDLKTVMEQGEERLKNNISVIVFPQTTRSMHFDPKQMSSIGVKLAKKNGVPVIPLALKTDAWKNGRLIKDLGRIDTDKRVHFAFGKPILVEGKGIEEQDAINSFIEENLNKWGH